MWLSMDALEQNLKNINAKIAAQCAKNARSIDSVKVLLATKTVSPERIRTAARLGYKLCGENKAQELLAKRPQLADVGIEWHFIGHLQSNKVKDVIDCALIHSVDRLSLAEEISKRAQTKNQVNRILVEVNTSGDATKSGVAPESTLELCRQISTLPGIIVEGLMTIAKDSEDTEIVRSCFRKLRELSIEISEAHLKNVNMKELSMGMSQDYLIAIEEGATLLRLGSAVFGNRPV